MKNLIIIAIFHYFALGVSAQTANIKGVLIDADESEPLVGASVVLQKTDEASQKKMTVTDINGKFQLENIINGTFELTVSYVGYEAYKKEIVVNSTDINLGNIPLKAGKTLKEVVVTGSVAAALQKGDTTQFNAQAYKTLPDANASDLLEKMPTVVIENGKIQAQGENVKQVLVDGKPFFGNDPNAALKNLPAEIIDKIQIFDQQSDQAQFSGFDDGEANKTINIVTKSNMRNGQFGKIYAGYGYQDKYQAGGNVNIFNGDQRISIIGMSNNINQQNFAAEDLLGVVGSSGGKSRGGGSARGAGGAGGGGNRGSSANDFLVSQQGGITTSRAVGINFSDKWRDKLNATASYFFNKSDNNTEKNLTRQFFGSSAGLAEVYREESIANSNNLNHRISSVLNYAINKNNTLILRSNFTWQGNKGLQYTLGETQSENAILNKTQNDFSANLSAVNLRNSLLWRYKFNKQGRTLSANLTGGLAPKSGQNNLLADNFFETNTTALKQLSTLDNKSWNLSGDVQYTEPISEKSQFLVNYKASYQQEESNKETFDFEEAAQKYTLFNEDLSNIFSNDYLSQSIGTGYNIQMGNWRLNTRANLQWAKRLTEQTLPYQATTNNVFFNVLPMATLAYNPSKSNNFRLMYRSQSQLPTIEQLQNVINNTNPLQLSIGNSNLVQGIQHNLFARYTKTNTEKSSVFFAMLGGSLTRHYIGKSLYYSAADFDASLESTAQITVPMNIDGQYSLRSLLTYGFGITPIKSNLNIDLMANHTRTPGLTNEVMNYTSNTNTGIGVTLSSNISERIDFTLSSRTNFNFVGNTLATTANNNYFNQKSKFNVNWIVGKGIVFRTDISHDSYKGLADNLDQSYLLWNMSVGKKLLKNDSRPLS